MGMAITMNILDYINGRLTHYLMENKWIGLGLGNSLDKIANWDINIINSLVKEYFQGNFLDLTVSPTEIKSVEDFLKVFIYLFIHGKGGEVPIVNQTVCSSLEKYFCFTNAVGGTPVHAACALTKLGFPAFVCLNTFSPELLTLIAAPNFYTVWNGEIVSIRELLDTAKDFIYAPHYIFQYLMNDLLFIGKRRISSFQSNRIIMPYDNINKEMRLNEYYFDYILNNGKQISSLVISGFNSISDESLLNARLRELNKYLQQIKAKYPHLLVYLEDAGYHVFHFKEIVLQSFAGNVDLLSVNEDEISEIIKNTGRRIDFEDLTSLVGELNFIAIKYGFKGVILHTKDFALYYGEKLNCDLEKGLMCGNLLATTKARLGRFGNMTDLKETLLIPDSTIGLKLQQQLKTNQFSKYVTLSPAKHVARPLCTIGLGDTFVGGVQICFDHR
jgi:ADP-dependent phosphofructokinase/glucokinase